MERQNEAVKRSFAPGAILASMYARAHGSKDATPADFIPGEEPLKVAPEVQAAEFKRMVKKHNEGVK